MRSILRGFMFDRLSRRQRGGHAPATAPAPATATVALPLPAEQVVTHVSRTIAWYRRIVALQQLAVDSDDVVPRDRLYQAALTSLQLAFDFGHAASAMAGKAQIASKAPGAAAEDSQDSDSPGSAVDQAAARLADRISNLQAQLTSLDEQIGHAAANDEDTLVARRSEISAALDLAREIQATVGRSSALKSCPTRMRVALREDSPRKSRTCAARSRKFAPLDPRRLCHRPHRPPRRPTRRLSAPSPRA